MGAQWKTGMKEANAAARGKIISKLAKEIMMAA
jgi:transcriptional/translational regulatory protein YebC/TACO1